MTERVLFELKGKSRAAARYADLERDKEFETNPPGSDSKSFDDLYSRLFNRIAHEKPDVAGSLGLNAPATVVYKGKGTLPRAYSEYPETHHSYEEPRRYFIYSPVDYKGEYFKPEDAIQLKGKKRAVIEDMLGGWDPSRPIIPAPRAGIATPDDYTPVDFKHPFNEYAAPETRGYRCFVAGGRTLDIISNLKRRDGEFTKAMDTLRLAINQIAETTMFPAMLKSLPPGEELHSGASYSYGGSLGSKAEVHISISRKGKGEGNFGEGGKKMSIPETPHFLIEEKMTEHVGKLLDKICIIFLGMKEYVLMPRTDTPEGLALKPLFDAVPPKPFYSDYPELHADFVLAQPSLIEKVVGVNSVVPQVIEFSDFTVLRYNSDDSAVSSFCPPDCKPISEETYSWLQSDQGDRKMGITPPPMPAQVENEIRITRADFSLTDMGLLTKSVVAVIPKKDPQP